MFLEQQQPVIAHNAPSEMNISCLQGSSPPDTSFDVWNSGKGILNFTISSNQPWISHSLSARTSNSTDKDRSNTTITLHYSTNNLAPGNHSSTIMINSADAKNSPIIFAVSLSVKPNIIEKPSIAHTIPYEASISCLQGSNPSNDSFEVWNSGTGTLNYTITTDQPWISCHPSKGTSTTKGDDGTHNNIKIFYSTTSLILGSHSAAITIDGADATNTPVVIKINLIVEPKAIEQPASDNDEYFESGEEDESSNQSTTPENTAVDSSSKSDKPKIRKGPWLIVGLICLSLIIYFWNTYHPSSPRLECTDERGLGQEALQHGVLLSNAIGKIEEQENVLNTVKKSGGNTTKIAEIKRTIRKYRLKRDEILTTYSNKTRQLSKSTAEKVTCALDSIREANMSNREEIVAKLLRGHLDILQRGGELNNKLCLADFKQQFKNISVASTQAEDGKQALMTDFKEADAEHQKLYNDLMSNLTPGMKDQLQKEEVAWKNMQEDACKAQNDDISILRCRVSKTKKRVLALKSWQQNLDTTEPASSGKQALLVEFNMLDKEITREYSNLMSSLSQDMKVELKRDQIAWIKQKDSDCNAQSDDVSALNCRLTKTRERIQVLINWPNGKKPVQTEISAGNNDIESTIRSYFRAVQDKRVEDAVKMYSSLKQGKIKVDRIRAIARDTEYYAIDSIDVGQSDDQQADTVVRLRHKLYNLPVETWEINISLTKEDGLWKILSTPGRKL